MKFNALKNIPKKSLKLAADKLLYSCDIALAAQESATDIKFMAQGKFRMGPLSSNVQVQSEFEKVQENLYFKRYRVDVERIGFYENYEMVDGAIYYSNSKGQEVTITLNEQAFQDPLSFLFQLANEGKSFVENKKEIPLLIGKRIENITSDKVNGILSLLKKSKLLAYLKEEVDKLIIEIPKLKVKLQLLFDKIN
ncbi:MAG: hypothetical protein HRT44_00825 [Bdellovibrionales bacterium]|nr:hypothetical protein [Bdellovibrionales bacterium]NQZ17793.1 hypothetical protein [Bdellovibrionales bacterium]